MLLRVLLACLVLLVAAPARAEDPLGELLEPVRVKFGLPAIGAAVAKDGRLVASGAVGTRVLGLDIPVTVDDRFHIGSDTKAMTATLAGMLVEQGKLDWTTTIGDVLGPGMPGLKPNFAAITLEQLLSHTSGLPSDNEEIAALYFAPAYEVTSAAYRRTIIAAWGTKHEPERTGAWPFQYSNLGYIVVGAMIEQVTGEP